MTRKALEGVKVADFTWVAAGPLTMSYLALAGATVVKVESSKRVDASRTFPAPTGPGGFIADLTFSQNNSNKLSISVNLKNPKGLEVAKRLVAWADVVAENYRPGTMEKWGLGYEDLKKINPSIIMFHSSARGQTGPDALVAENGITLQSLTGFTFLTGWPDRDPTPPWNAYTDITAPALGAAMLVGALDYRSKTGKGQCLDLSQFESGLHFLATPLLDYFANGRGASRLGNSCSYAAPHGVYRCAGEDRWCTIAIFSEEEWQSLCKVIRQAGLSDNPKFNTVTNRKENEVELNKLIEDWTSSHTPEEVMDILQKNSVSAGIVENSVDIFNDPQLKARGFIQQLNHDEMGQVSHHNVAFKLSKTPCELNTPGPLLGQHSEYVCREFLGMSDEEFVELINIGALD